MAHDKVQEELRPYQGQLVRTAGVEHCMGFDYIMLPRGSGFPRLGSRLRTMPRKLQVDHLSNSSVFDHCRPARRHGWQQPRICALGRRARLRQLLSHGSLYFCRFDMAVKSASGRVPERLFRPGRTCSSLRQDWSLSRAVWQSGQCK